MRPSARLLSLYTCRITLFTRANCSLCDDAKLALSRVWERRPFDFREVNVMAPGEEAWKDAYEFDTPVIHIDKAFRCQTTTLSRKLMHRFTASQVLELMDKVDGTTAARAQE